MDKARKVRDKALSYKFVRFCFSGALSFSIDIFGLIILIYFLNFNPYWTLPYSVLGKSGTVDISVANMVSVSMGVTVSFLSNLYWTFKTTDIGKKRQLRKYLTVLPFLFIFNNVLFGFFVVNLDLNELFAKVVVAGIQMFISFTVYKLYVYK